MKNKLADTNKLLKIKTVQKQLVRCLAHFPGNGRSLESMALIAPDYLEAFKGHYDLEFTELVAAAIQEDGRSFFPTIGDLKKIEMSQRSYNPYGGSGGFPLAEDAIYELSEAAKEPHQDITADNRRRINEFLERIGGEID